MLGGIASYGAKTLVKSVAKASKKKVFGGGKKADCRRADRRHPQAALVRALSRRARLSAAQEPAGSA